MAVLWYSYGIRWYYYCTLILTMVYEYNPNNEHSFCYAVCWHLVFWY